MIYCDRCGCELGELPDELMDLYDEVICEDCDEDDADYVLTPENEVLH